MSASLVGSEMCIRDSIYNAPPLPAQKDSGRHAASPEPADGVREVRQGPVSYTHLTLPTICSV
eukprot:8095300-Alexandrium_andersonii.AAC.1